MFGLYGHAELLLEDLQKTARPKHRSIAAFYGTLELWSPSSCVTDLITENRVKLLTEMLSQRSLPVSRGSLP